MTTFKLESTKLTDLKKVEYIELDTSKPHLFVLDENAPDNYVDEFAKLLAAAGVFAITVTCRNIKVFNTFPFHLAIPQDKVDTGVKVVVEDEVKRLPEGLQDIEEYKQEQHEKAKSKPPVVKKPTKKKSVSKKKSVNSNPRDGSLD